jgi:hypothetical protein
VRRKDKMQWNYNFVRRGGVRLIQAELRILATTSFLGPNSCRKTLTPAVREAHMLEGLFRTCLRSHTGKYVLARLLYAFPGCSFLALSVDGAILRIHIFNEIPDRIRYLDIAEEGVIFDSMPSFADIVSGGNQGMNKGQTVID